MLSVKELADRMWAGKDIEMIIAAASNAYRNDSARDLDIFVQRLLGKWGIRFLAATGLMQPRCRLALSTLI